MNLTWSYLPSPQVEFGGLPVRLTDALRFVQTKTGFRFPSYEQFVGLAEGLHRCGHEIIPNGRLVVLEDRPGRHQHLLAQLNSEIIVSDHLRPVDKLRQVGNTDLYVNCYLTGLSVSPDFSNNIKVDQLYIQEDGLELFDFKNLIQGR